MKTILALSFISLLLVGTIASAYASTTYVNSVFLLINVERTFVDGTMVATTDKLDYFKYWSGIYSFAPFAVYNEYTPSGKAIQSIRVTYELYDKNPDFSIGANHALSYSVYIDDSRAGTIKLESTPTGLIFETRGLSDGYTVYKLYDRTFSAAELQSKLAVGKAGNFIARADSIVGTYREDVNKRISIDDTDNDVKTPISTDGIAIIEPPIPPPPPAIETSCFDGIDNDQDGLVDSADSDCYAPPPPDDEEIICLATNPLCNPQFVIGIVPVAAIAGTVIGGIVFWRVRKSNTVPGTGRHHR